MAGRKNHIPLKVQYVVRRATTEDLSSLRAMWQQALLPVEHLERSLTEFFIISRDDNLILGAVGVKKSGWHGLLHSEVYVSTKDEFIYRPILWERLQKILRGLGILRVWITSPCNPQWQEIGFKPASPHQIQKLPSDFKSSLSTTWWTYTLADEDSLQNLIGQIEHALKLNAATERSQWEKWITICKVISFIISLIFLGLTIWMLAKLLKR